ncbi:MAG: hypothetical protein QW734_06555 [Candidatus Bathyarchaeia archaeon]
MFELLKRIFRDKEIEKKREKAITELAYFLTNYGFGIEEAIKAAKDFWKKHESKLKDIL